MTNTKTTFQRLPTSVVPQKYTIDYTVIDLVNFRFAATQRIELLVQTATKTLTCHAVELELFDVSIQIQSKPGEATATSLACSQLAFDAYQETVTFQFDDELPRGATVVLSMCIHGLLGVQMRGLYRNEYTHDGEKCVLAVTQFQPCDARRAFVCWDEPAIKARFAISMATPASYRALSNMHVAHMSIRDKQDAKEELEKHWQFAETPPMSTSIVAMVVGQFDVLSDRTDDGVLLNVYTAPGQSERARFALNVAKRGLSYFVQQFGIPYPLQKLDFVTIPDFLGAMENWGLVPAMDSYLLVDEKRTSRANIIQAARTICHELSHMWFGNLVTMEWWSGLWLNEGFAQYMEFDAVHALFPDWNVWEAFVQNETLGGAFVKDAMATSHPLEAVVDDPKAIDQIFDVISYKKGASVVRMLAEYVGRDVFYKGLRIYLTRFSYQSTSNQDVWDGLEEASGLKIAAMADSWTRQTGFPLITIHQNENDGALSLTQQRFLADFDSDSKSAKDLTLWDIPLTLVTSSAPAEIQRLGIWQAPLPNRTPSPHQSNKEVSHRLEDAVSSTASWFLLNPHQTGFYLVNYPPAMWKRLHDPIRSLTLPVVDRLSLLSTMFKLATAGVVPITNALDFLDAYADEPAFLCWKEIADYMAQLSTMFALEPFFAQLQGFIRRLFAPALSRLGWEPTAHDNIDFQSAQFRALAIERMAAAAHSATIHHACARFAQYMDGDKTALSPEVRGIVFGIHADTVDHAADVVQQLQQLYLSSDQPGEREDCLLAMGRVLDHPAKLQVLEWALETVKSQELSRVLRGVASDDAGVDAAWAFVTTRYATLQARLSPTLLGNAMALVVGRFQRASDVAKLEQFKATHDVRPYIKRLEGALEGVNQRLKQSLRDRDALAAWLAVGQRELHAHK